MASNLSGQSIALTQTPNVSVCTGDTLCIQVTLSAGFNATNHFSVELVRQSGGVADFINDAFELPIAKWTPNTGSAAADTNNPGIKTMCVVIPDTIQNNGNYSIRMLGDNPVTISDTFNLAVNVTIPASIDSIIGGFDNIYTPGNPDDWGRCVDDTIILRANKGYNYQWYVNGVRVGIAQSRSDDTYDSLVVYAPGDYYVVVSSGPVCPGESEHQLINNYVPSPMITLGNPLSTIQPWIEILDEPFPGAPLIDSIQFCAADSVLFYGEAPTIPGEVYSYRWLKDTLTAGGLDTVIAIPGALNDSIWVDSTLMNGSTIPLELRLYLEVTEMNTGCVTLIQNPRWLFMDTIPDVEISAIPWPGEPNVSTTICIEDSVLLEANSFGSGPDWHYQWQVEFPLGSGVWTNLPNDTNRRLQVDTALIPDSAMYRLRTDNLTCTWWSAPIQVNIVPNPFFQFLPSDSVAVCAGDSALVAVNGNGLQYTWSDGFIGSSRYLSTPGSYWVRASGINQCPYYDTIVLYPLVVNANAGPDQTIDPDETATMAASGGVSYYWYADQPVYFSNPRDPNTLTRPTEDTTWYYVEVTGANGCTAIDSMMMIIRDPFGTDPNVSNVQNVMTPNGDGSNDVFDLREVVRLDGCDLMVMNRWGDEVYTEENYTTGWNGVNNGGVELPDGTYYYVLACGDEIRFRGAITIIRNND